MYESLPDLLTRAEAQEVLKIGKGTMLKLIHEGSIPSHIIAGRFRIEKNDLIDFINRSQFYSNQPY